MAVFQNKVKKIIEKFKKFNLEKLQKKFNELDYILSSLKLSSLKLPNLASLKVEDVQKRINFIENFSNVKLKYITQQEKVENFEVFQGNIENYIGLAKIPIGLVGPLKIKGLNAQGVFFVPMATTEGALIASYTRGSIITYLSGVYTLQFWWKGFQGFQLLNS